MSVVSATPYFGNRTQEKYFVHSNPIYEVWCLLDYRLPKIIPRIPVDKTMRHAVIVSNTILADVSFCQVKYSNGTNAHMIFLFLMFYS